MNSMEDPDKIYTVIKQCIENRCGAPARESASGVPAKKSVWEQWIDTGYGIKLK